MEMIRSQMVFLAGSLISGFAVMACYEVVRVLRQVFHLKTKRKWLLDTLFFLIAAIMVFRMIFICNFGTMRIFFVVAFGLGGVAYHHIFGNAISRGVIRAIFWIRRKIMQPCVRKCKRLLKKTKKNQKKT